MIADEKAVTAKKSSKPFDTSVLGIVSTDPGYTMFPKDTMSQNRTVLKNERLLALSGRVPVKATNENGNIKPGDLLTTSSTAGFAMKCPVKTQEQKLQCFGVIVAKALESCDKDNCKILALITLQ